jgi:cytochrome c553
MKTSILISLAVAAVVLAGCNEKTQEKAQETQEVAVQTVEKAKEVVANVAEKTKEQTQEVAQKVKEGAEEVAKEVKEGAQEAAGTVAAKVDSALYGKCVACHGIDGKTKALGKSAVLAGQTQEELVTKLKGYKAGTINVAGMGMLMQGQVKDMSDVELEAVAAYIATFK